MDEEYVCPDCNRVYPTSQTCDCWIVWSDEEIYDDDLPGNPYFYKGSDRDDAYIENRLNYHVLAKRIQEIEKENKYKKELCMDLMDLIDDKKEELGSGKYKELVELLQNDLFMKIEDVQHQLEEEKNYYYFSIKSYLCTMMGFQWAI